MQSENQYKLFIHKSINLHTIIELQKIERLGNMRFLGKWYKTWSLLDLHKVIDSVYLYPSFEKNIALDTEFYELPECELKNRILGTYETNDS